MKWYRVIHDIPVEQRSLVLERLQPATEHQLYLVAFALSEQPTNISGKVHFVSPDATQNDSWIPKVDPSEEETPPAPFSVREEEVVIVVLVLAVWVFVIVHQQVGKDPDVGALPAAVPLAPRHRQARPSAPQRRSGTPREVQPGIRGRQHRLPPAQDEAATELRLRRQSLQEPERVNAVRAAHAQEGQECRGPEVTCHTGG